MTQSSHSDPGSPALQPLRTSYGPFALLPAGLTLPIFSKHAVSPVRGVLFFAVKQRGRLTAATETLCNFDLAASVSATLCTAETESRDAVGLQCRKSAPLTLAVGCSITGSEFASNSRVPGVESNRC